MSSKTHEQINNVAFCEKLIALASTLAEKPMYEGVGLDSRLTEGFRECARERSGFISTLGLTVKRAAAGRYDTDDSRVNLRDIRVFRAFMHTAYTNPDFCV